MLAYCVDFDAWHTDYVDDVADEVERGGRGGDSGDRSSSVGLHCPLVPGPSHVAEGQEGDLGSKLVHVELCVQHTDDPTRPHAGHILPALHDSPTPPTIIIPVRQEGSAEMQS